jgi:NhaP-type Na+/H+ or K+/H+ antiporter
MSDGVGMFFTFLFLLVAAAAYMEFTEFLGGGLGGALLGLLIVWGGALLLNWVKEKWFTARR